MRRIFARRPALSTAVLVALAATTLATTALATTPALTAESTSESAKSWTQWGGPGQDFVARSGQIAESWSEAGPREIWSRDLGDGYSTILFEEGRLYTQYRTEDEEAVIALNAADGATVWEHRYDHSPHADHAVQFGIGPRATPLIAGDRIFTIGVAGRMFALDKAKGTPIWSQDLWGDELGGTVLPHGYSSSPIAFGDHVIALVGGEKAGVVAFSQATGEIAWKSDPFRNSYATPRLFQVHGKDHLVTFMAGESVGLDPATGRVLWTYPMENPFGQNISPPVLLDGRFLFMSSPQAGSHGLELVPTADGGMEAKPLWLTKKVQFYHVTNVVDGDWVYGSSGTRSPAFMSAINARTGEVAWRERGFGKANVVGADGRLVVLDEDGVLSLATATPEGLTVQSRVQLLDRVAWSAPTIVGSSMYVRDTERIMALDLSRSGTGAASRPATAEAEAESAPAEVAAEPLGDPPVDASEALKLMYRVDAAARAVSSVRMTGSVRESGTATLRTGDIEGEVVLDGWSGGGAARFRADVTSTGEQGDVRRLTGGGNGEQFFLVDHDTKTAYVDMDPNVMGSARGSIMGLGMVEFVHPSPFSDEVGAAVVELRGTETIAGVKCREVFVDYGEGRGQSSWFIAEKDHLPRRRVRYVTDRDGHEGTIEISLTSLEIDPELDDGLFELEQPEGYRLVEDFAP